MKRNNRWEFCKKFLLGLIVLTITNTIFPQDNDSLSENKNGGKPNILFIYSDQHSFNYAGFANHKIVQTPNLDKLAGESTLFTNSYSSQPVCVPGRASLMTGMYASDVGSYCNTTIWDKSYPLWGKYFEESGYYVRASGKMDLDDNKDNGFDEHFTTHAHKYNPDITSLFRQPLGYRVDERSNIDGSVRDNYHEKDLEITNDAIDFINKDSKDIKKPWALYLGYQQPHPPFIAKSEYFDMYYPDNIDLPSVTNNDLEQLHEVYQELRHFKNVATPIEIDKIKRARAAYYGMITEMDELIGRVINSLKESGQYDNTIIVYTSDHGESLGEHGLWHKNNLYDCSVRIPLIIKGPNFPKNRKINTPVSQIDIVPTLLENCGIKTPDYLRGKSLNRTVNSSYDSDNVVYAESHSEGNCTGSFMIRKGEWKYVYFTNYGELLFNLDKDPLEKNNLSDNKKYADKLDELKGELFSRVDPDKITKDAFRKQKTALNELINENTEDELFQILVKRLGKGQARTLAQRLKDKY